MIDKVNDNAYFIIDYSSLYSQIVSYDPNIANQTIYAGNFSDQIDIPQEIDKAESRCHFCRSSPIMAD